MRCTAHVLNIIVQAGLEDIDDSIIRIRNVVRSVRSSPPRLKDFKKSVKKIPELTSKALPSLDVPTTWNSTYMMLEAACRLGMAFRRLGKDDKGYNEWFLEDDDVQDKEEGENFSSSKGKKKKKKSKKKTLGAPKDDDWKNAEGLVKFLEVFYNATLKFSGSLYATSNAYFKEFMTGMSSMEEIQKNCDSIVLSVISRMIKKWKKYWNLMEMDRLLFVAIVIDPCYKLKFIEWAITKIVDKDRAKIFTSMVKQSLEDLYDCYEKLHRVSPSNEAGGTFGGVLIDDDVGDDLASKFSWEIEQENASKDVSEVESYLNEFVKIEHNSFEVLNWWKINSHGFPIISEIARDVLVFPVSSVASESAFSTAGRVIDPFRSSLTPNTVEALICTQDWLRSPSIAIILRASLERVQDYEAVDAEMFAKFSTLSSNMED